MGTEPDKISIERRETVTFDVKLRLTYSEILALHQAVRAGLSESDEIDLGDDNLFLHELNDTLEYEINRPRKKAKRRETATKLRLAPHEEDDNDD